MQGKQKAVRKIPTAFYNRFDTQNYQYTTGQE